LTTKSTFITHVTQQEIFASREAAKIAKKKSYIDEQDKQDKRPIQNPAYRCKNKSTFALLQSLFPFSRSSRLRVR